tara:strand:- start:387 stop:590 length:204 start_codon:yes stop_codon:yes gene_type:complete
MNSFYVKEAATMVGALVRTTDQANGATHPQIVVAYMADSTGEWIRFIKDKPDAWRKLTNFTVLSRGH